MRFPAGPGAATCRDAEVVSALAERLAHLPADHLLGLAVLGGQLGNVERDRLHEIVGHDQRRRVGPQSVRFLEGRDRLREPVAGHRRAARAAPERAGWKGPRREHDGIALLRAAPGSRVGKALPPARRRAEGGPSSGIRASRASRGTRTSDQSTNVTLLISRRVVSPRKTFFESRLAQEGHALFLGGLLDLRGGASVEDQRRMLSERSRSSVIAMRP